MRVDVDGLMLMQRCPHPLASSPVAIQPRILTPMMPPPLPELVRNTSSSPRIVTIHSMTTCSSSVHAGEHDQLKPGLVTDELYMSPRMDSNVTTEGK